MILIAKKLDTRERRYPFNGLKRIIRETQFEFESEDHVDILWVADDQIINMIPIDYNDDLYELHVNDAYMELILANQK